MKRRSLFGFTMIELLVTVAIIAILTSIGLVSFRAASRNARNSKRQSDLENLRQSLVLYRTDTGAYPSTNSFATMLSAIQSYTSSVNIQDPQNTGSYVYTYNSDGVTFTLSGALEPNATPYTVTNP